jgi:ATP-dependent helicase/nuclease subunit B
LRDEQAAKALFCMPMRLSPTRIEQYYNCPFSYFARRGLRLRPRRKAELSPMEAGTMLHHILEKMVSRHGAKLAEIGEDRLRGEVAVLVQEYLEQRVKDKDDLSERLLYSFFRMQEWLVGVLLHLGAEFAQSEFVPVAFEVPVGEGGDIPPYAVDAEDGGRIIIEGTIDRVDAADVGGKRFVRVVDYKSNGKAFALSDVYYGLNLQMLVYLFAVCGKDDEKTLLPAGILYMPAMGKYLSMDRGTDDERLRANRERQYRMDGLLLDDPQVLRAMEKSRRGVFLPVGEKTAGSKALVSSAEFGQIEKLVQDRVRQMAKDLQSGKIAARPVASGDMKICRWCDYAGICAYEPGDPVRPTPPVDRADILIEEAARDE